MLLDSALAYASANREKQLEELKTLLRIPSVSVSEEQRLSPDVYEHRADVKKAAIWLVNALHRLRMEKVEVRPDHLFVYGERVTSPHKPTILFYGHYDVQSPGSLDAWHSPPFEPIIRGESLYARGAADMKGSLWALLQAVQAITKVGELPINVKILLEGQEEIGSPEADGYIAANRDRLRSDVVISLDGGMDKANKPSIVISARGCAYYEVEITGPQDDLHSGDFGGVVENPVHVLCALIAGLHDKNGRIALPGFYDAVVSSDTNVLGSTQRSDEEWLAAAKVTQLWGDPDYSTDIRATMRPSLDVSGIVGGFTGQGLKNIIPNRASAKIGVRLVPNQNPTSVSQEVRDYLHSHCPQTVTYSLRTLAEIPFAAADQRAPFLDLLRRSLKESFNVEPHLVRKAGTEPFTGKLQKSTGAAPVAIGFRLSDSAIHGPNEHQHLPTLFRGIDALIRFLIYMGGDTPTSCR